MGSYVPNTPEERQEMLQAIGLPPSVSCTAMFRRRCIWIDR